MTPNNHDTKPEYNVKLNPPSVRPVSSLFHTRRALFHEPLFQGVHELPVLTDRLEELSLPLDVLLLPLSRLSALPVFQPRLGDGRRVDIVDFEVVRDVLP